MVSKPLILRSEPICASDPSLDPSWTAYTPLEFFAEAAQIHCAAGQGPSAHRSQFLNYEKSGSVRCRCRVHLTSFHSRLSLVRMKKHQWEWKTRTKNKKTWSRMKTKNCENSLLGPKTCSVEKYFKNYSNVFSPTKNSDRKKKQPFHLSSIQGKDSPRLKSRSSSAQCPLRALRSLSFLSSFLPVRRARRIARNTVTTRVHL